MQNTQYMFMSTTSPYVYVEHILTQDTHYAEYCLCRIIFEVGSTICRINTLCLCRTHSHIGYTLCRIYTICLCRIHVHVGYIYLCIYLCTFCVYLFMCIFMSNTHHIFMYNTRSCRTHTRCVNIVYSSSTAFFCPLESAQPIQHTL